MLCTQNSKRRLRKSSSTSSWLCICLPSHRFLCVSGMNSLRWKRHPCEHHMPRSFQAARNIPRSQTLPFKDNLPLTLPFLVFWVSSSACLSKRSWLPLLELKTDFDADKHLLNWNCPFPRGFLSRSVSDDEKEFFFVVYTLTLKVRRQSSRSHCRAVSRPTVKGRPKERKDRHDYSVIVKKTTELKHPANMLMLGNDSWRRTRL